jgi:hypothetical protein
MIFSFGVQRYDCALKRGDICSRWKSVSIAAGQGRALRNQSGPGITPDAVEQIAPQQAKVGEGDYGPGSYDGYENVFLRCCNYWCLEKHSTHHGI